MKCGDCKHWGDGDGKGFAYDVGHMNYCNHKQIKGVQHPSFGAVHYETETMLYIEGDGRPQLIMTRASFGCVLFEPIYIKIMK
jgi:hypothetical protein